ncbi:MAG: pilus motility taxis protein HmpF [Calothrix sp. FI2-JRJ7]|nr:pilus motility taxis protein HmpF [Calothrix sp. FI2-JRJ7]
MLYLAEVQKQKGGLLGGGSKAELKLLACQRNDQSWSAVSEEIISAEDANKLNDGALVMVELSPTRQVQRIQEAGRPLATILQNYSRQVEKFKAKEEEINQWKESLTFQAQELSRRELEMEDRMAQLQQLEEECQNLDSEKQEIDNSRAEIETLKQEIEKRSQELEGAWNHLRGEQGRLEELSANLQQGTVIDSEQAGVFYGLLEGMQASVVSTDPIQESLNYAFEVVNTQQELLNTHWQKFEQQKASVEQQQLEIENLSQELDATQNECQQIKAVLDQQTNELKANTAVLDAKQEYVRILKEQLRSQEDLYQQVCSLAAPGDASLSESVDVEALESMSLEELEKTVQDLQDKLNIDSSFVHDQEQELNYKEDAIKEIQQKISIADVSELATLEEELNDEKDLYQMLNETLVGQRRSLVQRQGELRQYQTVLMRRQGKNSNDQGSQIDLKPILAQIELQQKQQFAILQDVERQIEQINAGIELSQDTIDNQTSEYEEKYQDLKVKEDNLLMLKDALAESRAKVSLYEETLQPTQDGLDKLRQKLQILSDTLAQIQQSSNSQFDIVSQMQQALQNLTAQPQLAA